MMTQLRSLLITNNSHPMISTPITYITIHTPLSTHTHTHTDIEHTDRHTERPVNPQMRFEKLFFIVQKSWSLILLIVQYTVSLSCVHFPKIREKNVVAANLPGDSCFRHLADVFMATHSTVLLWWVLFFCPENIEGQAVKQSFFEIFRFLSDKYLL